MMIIIVRVGRARVIALVLESESESHLPEQEEHREDSELSKNKTQKSE